MYSQLLQQLKTKQSIIEEDLRNITQSQNQHTSLAVKIVEVRNLLRNYETVFSSSDEQENINRRTKLNEIKKQCNEYNKLLQESVHKLEVNQTKHEDCTLQFEEMVPVNEENAFVNRNISKINTFIFGAFDTFDNLKKQSRYIESTREKIKSGLYNIGVGEEMVTKISNRYLSDYSFFWACVVVVVLLIIVIRYLLK